MTDYCATARPLRAAATHIRVVAPTVNRRYHRKLAPLGAVALARANEGSSETVQMTLRVRAAVDKTVVSAEGELDLATLPPLVRALRDATALTMHTIVDLTAVTFADSSTVRVLIAAHRRARSREGTLHLVAPPGSPTRRVLDLTGVSTALTVHDTLAAVSNETMASDPVVKEETVRRDLTPLDR